MFRFLTALLLTGTILLTTSSRADDSNAAQLVATSAPLQLPQRVTFNAHIRPIMSNTCFACHGPDEEMNESAYRIDSFASATGVLPSDDEMRGIVPGDFKASEVYNRIMGLGYGDPMPPEHHRHQLTSYEKALFAKWIEQGADYEQHWSYSPLTRPNVPDVTTHPDKIENEIDAFVLSRLQTEGIDPSPTADKTTLLRRLSLDLIGLPPTVQELDAFLADPSGDAYQRQVERLLASPHFGERMASSWLDIVRFADTVGFHGDQNLRNFSYRDYVINAFNENKPFDEFTRQQIAGDLKPNPTPEDLVATGLLRLNMVTREGGAQPDEYLSKYKADRVRMLGTAWLGSTLACCECHNHKFDPFTAKDFYSFGAFFDDVQQWGVYSDYGYSPNKDLKGFNNDYPFPPEMRVESASLRAEIRSLIQERDDALLSLLAKASGNDSPESQTWTSSLNEVLAEHPDGWVPLRSTQVQTVGGTAHQVLDDGSVLLTGKSAGNETVSIASVPTTPMTINSVRVEVLPDENNGGNVGRGADGRFSLGFAASVVRRDESAPEMRTNRPRFVRIELSGKQILSLAEVEIFETARDANSKNASEKPINIARDGKASQSSDYKTALASLAIDGETEGDYYKANSVTHTSIEGSNPWWEVDLGSERSIESIVVWNRVDGNYAERLNGFRLILLDDNRNVLQTAKPATPKPSTRIAIPDQIQVIPNAPLAVAWGEADREDPKRFSNGRPPRTLGDVWRSGPARWQLPANENQLPHTAVFHFKKPLVLAVGEQLVVELKSSDVGRVRLSVTPIGHAVAGWPAASEELKQALATKSSERTDRDHAAIAGAMHVSTVPVDRQHGDAKRFRDQILDLHSAMAMTLVAQSVDADQIPISRVRPRGNWQDESGELAPPGFPSFLPGGDRFSKDDTDSNRRLNRTDLADWLTSPDNPLVPRHVVNRTWKHFFGAGLSGKLDDLGSQGEWPSHPLLLDRLATEFVIGGWDVKNLIRLMVNSRTYRQSVTRNAELVESDPYNRLLAQASPRRLEAEAIRDNALAISGLLNDDYIGGPSVFPYQPDGHYSNLQFPNRGYTASGDRRQYRRGVYMHWQRTFLHPMLVNFDAPSRDECAADRSQSNSPQQALTLLNDPTFNEASHTMAASLMADNMEESLQTTINDAFRRAVARDAQPEEIAALQSLYERQLAYFSEHPEDASKFLQIGNRDSAVDDSSGDDLADDDLASLAAMSQVCRVILNLHETITRY